MAFFLCNSRIQGLILNFLSAILTVFINLLLIYIIDSSASFICCVSEFLILNLIYFIKVLLIIDLSASELISLYFFSVLSLLSFYRKEGVIVLLSDSSLTLGDPHFLSLKH